MSCVVVDITAEDIKVGEPQDCMKCAVARAIHRIPGFEKAYVNDRYIETDHDDRYQNCYHLPKVAQDFITRFDEGKQVEPLRFDLDTSEE